MTSIDSVLRVPSPSGASRWRPIMRRPIRRVSQVNSVSGEIVDTVHTAADWPGCLTRAELPTCSCPGSSRVTACTVGMKDGHRSTSVVRRQTTDGGALMTVLCSRYIPALYHLVHARRSPRSPVGQGHGRGGQRRL